MKREWVIECDDREKKPLLFPEHLVCLDDSAPATSQRTCVVRLVVRKTRLSFGDYRLACSPSRVVIERKASLAEIAVNCLSPSRREKFQQNLLDLSCGCSLPWLLFEGSPSRQEPVEGCDHPEIAMDALLGLLIRRGIQHSVLPSATIGQRQEAARYAARLLIQGALACPPTSTSLLVSPASSAAKTPSPACPRPPSPPASAS